MRDDEARKFHVNAVSQEEASHKPTFSNLREHLSAFTKIQKVLALDYCFI